VDFVVERLQFIARGLEFLAERLKFFLPLVGGEDAVLDTDNTQLRGSRSRGCRGGGASRSITGRSIISLGQGGQGQGESHGHDNSHNLAVHWIAWTPWRMSWDSQNLLLGLLSYRSRG